MSNCDWIVPTALISAAIAYPMLRPSPFACTAHPDADTSKPGSEVRLMPGEFHNEDCRRCHTGPMAELPPARVPDHEQDWKWAK